MSAKLILMTIPLPAIPLCLQLYSGYGYGVNYKTGYLDGKITDDGEFIPAPRNEATK